MEDSSDIQEFDQLHSPMDDNDTLQQRNEENFLLNELEEVELGKLVEAKSKLMYNQKINKNYLDEKNRKKEKIKSNFEAINKNKPKSEPKEFSALIKPKIQKTLPYSKTNTFKRDPRFDDLSGKLDSQKFKKSYSFVSEMASDYVSKISRIKKSLKNKRKLSEEAYDLLKKQTNFVKGWIKKEEKEQSREQIKKEINKENRRRLKIGKNPIYLKKQAMKAVVQKEEMEKCEGNAKMLKRKHVRDIKKKKKAEKRLLHGNE